MRDAGRDRWSEGQMEGQMEGRTKRGTDGRRREGGKGCISGTCNDCEHT